MPEVEATLDGLQSFLVLQHFRGGGSHLADDEMV